MTQRTEGATIRFDATLSTIDTSTVLRLPETASKNRRQGVATAALVGAVDLIAGLGGGTVEGYPEPADSVPVGFLYDGALSTYEKLGFTRDRKSASTAGS